MRVIEEYNELGLSIKEILKDYLNILYEEL